MIKFLLLLTFLFCGIHMVGAQSYGFTKATGTYTNLTAPTVLTATGWDNNNYAIQIGFPFNAGGVNYTSLTVNTDGNLYFNIANRVILTVYTADLYESPVPGTTSNVSYQLTGSPGNRILKVQWLNAGFVAGTTTDVTNFQIWLHENTNEIATHFGPETIANSSVVFDPWPIYGLFLNSNQSANTFSGPFLEDDPVNPVLTNLVNAPALPMLFSHPTNGLIYTFSPLFTGTPYKPAQLDFNCYPNPVSDLLYISGAQDLKGKVVTVKIYNATGTQVQVQSYNREENIQIDLSTLQAGIYWAEITTGESRFTKPVIKL